MKGRTFQLVDLKQGMALVDAQVKPMLASFLAAGMGLVLRVEEASKTREQEVKYHAMIGDISQQAQHLGSKWDADDWKRLLIDKFARETKRSHGRIIPNLDSDGVVEVGILSRKFSRRDAVEFIEWLYFWGSENGCEFTEKVLDPETGEIFKITWQQKVARRAASHAVAE